MRTPSLKILIVVFCFAMIWCVPRGTSTDYPEISADVDTPVIHIGDIFHLRIKITTPEGYRVLFPSKPPDLTPFEVIDQSFNTLPEKNESVSTDLWELSVSSYRVGDADIPPIKIQYKKPDGSTGTLTTDPITVRTESLLKEEQPQPRPPENPISVDARLKYKLAITGGLILLVAIILSLIFWARHLKQKKASLPPPPTPPQPAHVIALSELASLKKKSYPEAGAVKVFFIELSQILKTYLENRFAFPAVERTTGEIRRNLKSIPMSHDLGQLLLDILSLSDLVKFAKYHPEPSKCYSAFDDTKRFVEQTAENSISDTNTTGKTEIPYSNNEIRKSSGGSR